MGLRSIIQKLMSKRERYKEADEEVRIQEKIQERRKNANERELERFVEEDRQENIKHALETYRKRKHDDTWHGKTMLEQKNIFNSRDGRSLLKQRNLFAGGGKSIMKQKRVAY